MARAKRRKAADEEKIVVSSGNVFADIGLADAEELQTKVKVAFALNTILDRIGDLTQSEIADRLNTDQPKVSAVRNYKLDGLSVERLLGFLTALDCDIYIEIKPGHKGRLKHPGRIKVTVNAA